MLHAQVCVCVCAHPCVCMHGCEKYHGDFCDGEISIHRWLCILNAASGWYMVSYMYLNYVVSHMTHIKSRLAHGFDILPQLCER